jgi:hypothetical protein
MKGPGQGAEMCAGRCGVGCEPWEIILVEQILETFACGVSLDSKTALRSLW